jgi:glycosyltransferase involved in cell wall biosynthesis
VLIPPKQPAAIADAVVKLANDWPRRARYCKAAESRAITTFSLEHMVGKTEDLYSRLLSRARI